MISEHGGQAPPAAPAHGRRRRHPSFGRSRERGASLIEAMIGFLVVAVGMLATAQWQTRLRQAVDLARQQAEAVRVAQQELETLRAFTTRDHDASLTGFADITSAAARALAVAQGANAVYTLDRQVDDRSRQAIKALTIQVTWPDMRGTGRSLRLDSLLAGQAPALVLALAGPPAGRDASPLLGRHAAIPREALALGDGRSAFKPVSDGQEAWLFDERSGHIRARCSGIPASRATHQLTVADLGACTAVDAVLLSGRVRFALAAPPASADAAHAREPPLPLTMTLTTSSTGHPAAPVCLGEAVKLIDTGAVNGPRVLAVPGHASPASHGLLAWNELGDRHWRYHCAVALAPAASNGGGNGNGPSAAHWSGRLQFTPSGWTVGTVAGARRICRYSADTDGSGQIDRPAENTDTATGVEDALVEQNFLVVDGTQACPSRSPATLAVGALPWSDANPATVPHQP